jgi:RNA polymerase sigma-70 factor (ECF subfamily)
MPRLDPQSLPQHVDRLYRAAWALCGSPHDAEDLVQETFSRVLARPRFIRAQDELGYLMQALRNTFLSQRRTAARRPSIGRATLEDVEPVDHRTGERPEEALQAREVLAAITALSENHRLAVVAVDVVGLSYREAAAALGTREATIATRVFRAREQLAKDLDRGRSAREVEAPAAGARETLAPTAGPRETLAPTTGSHETLAPTAGPRETLAPTTGSHETLAPTTGARETLAPTAGARQVRAPASMPQAAAIPQLNRVARQAGASRRGKLLGPDGVLASETTND